MHGMMRQWIIRNIRKRAVCIVKPKRFGSMLRSALLDFCRRCTTIHLRGHKWLTPTITCMWQSTTNYAETTRLHSNKRYAFYEPNTLKSVYPQFPTRLVVRPLSTLSPGEPMNEQWIGFLFFLVLVVV